MANLTKAENEVGNNNQIMNFVNDEFGSIRCVEIDNEPWFVGKDVCIAFGDTNHKRSLRRIDKADKTMAKIQTAGGMQNITVLNESGLYSLLFLMQPAKAKGVSQNDPLIEERVEKLHRFKRWVTSEVLPQIRRTGGYIPYKNLSEAEFVLKALEIQQATIAELRGELEASKEDVDFARCVTASSDTIDMNTMAKLLQNDGYDIGRNRLFEILRSNGILMRDNMPYQRYVENGCFEVGEHVICNVIVPQTYVTGKGQKLVYRVVGDLED